jgi:hypothetical protein
MNFINEIYILLVSASYYLLLFLILFCSFSQTSSHTKKCFKKLSNVLYNEWHYSMPVQAHGCLHQGLHQSADNLDNLGSHKVSTQEQRGSSGCRSSSECMHQEHSAADALQVPSPSICSSQVLSSHL